MSLKENETLEEFVEQFQYNLQRYPHATLPQAIFKGILIKGMREEWIEKLNLMGKGEIYQEEYDEIVLLCIRCSWGSAHIGLGVKIL